MRPDERGSGSNWSHTCRGSGGLMLTADEIHDKLRGLDPLMALRVLDELDRTRVYEAERLVRLAWGEDRHGEALELIASLVKGTVAGVSA